MQTKICINITIGQASYYGLRILLGIIPVFLVAVGRTKIPAPTIVFSIVKEATSSEVFLFGLFYSFRPILVNT